MSPLRVVGDVVEVRKGLGLPEVMLQIVHDDVLQAAVPAHVRAFGHVHWDVDNLHRTPKPKRILGPTSPTRPCNPIEPRQGTLKGTSLKRVRTLSDSSLSKGSIGALTGSDDLRRAAGSFSLHGQESLGQSRGAIARTRSRFRAASCPYCNLVVDFNSPPTYL